ncbi:MAG: UPF0175 family protein [Deltaproteobacteria bacterium]|nr:UPF0175 family protein [Deltaproteobacteria bacterium]
MGAARPQITIEDLLQGKAFDEQQQAIKEGLVIRGYINGELSMGEVAEALGLGYVEAQDWLHSRGIATMRNLPPDLKRITKKSLHNVAKRLNIDLSE